MDSFTLTCTVCKYHYSIDSKFKYPKSIWTRCKYCSCIRKFDCTHNIKKDIIIGKCENCLQEFDISESCSCQ